MPILLHGRDSFRLKNTTRRRRSKSLVYSATDFGFVEISLGSLIRSRNAKHNAVAVSSAPLVSVSAKHNAVAVSSALREAVSFTLNAEQSAPSQWKRHLALSAGNKQ